MSRLFKYIPVFVLWLAGIGLCGHMIIIHDHHAETASLAQEEKCAASDQHNHHSGIPIHCHAFNDVASEKAVLFQFQSNIQCNELMLNLSVDSFVFELSLSYTLYPTPQTPYRNPHLRNSFSLRAPPSLG